MSGLRGRPGVVYIDRPLELLIKTMSSPEKSHKSAKTLSSPSVALVRVS